MFVELKRQKGLNENALSHKNQKKKNNKYYLKIEIIQILNQFMYGKWKHNLSQLIS